MQRFETREVPIDHDATTCEDEPDWGEIYRRIVVYYRTSFLFGQDTEDAAQDAVERMIAGEQRRDPRRPFLPWCYRIARNRAIDLIRARARVASFVGEGSVEDTPAHAYARPDESLELSDLQTEVEAFLEALKPSDREIAFLRFFEDLPYGEIAKVTGGVSATIRYRVHTIRRRLAEHLRERGYEETE